MLADGNVLDSKGNRNRHLGLNPSFLSYTRFGYLETNLW